jgi:hypothetical protein
MRIQRSWRDTVIYAAWGVGSAVATYFAHGWAAGAHGLVWLIAWALTLVAAVMALAFVWIAARESGRATCPACNAVVGGLDAKVAFRAVPCKGCGRYVACQSGAVSMVPDDYLHATPLFVARLPQNVTWPETCCVCTATATRTVTVEKKETQTGRNLALGAAGLAVGALVVRTGGGNLWRTEVPHCGEHHDGAEIDTTDESTSGLDIKFRSYRYWQLFRDLNAGQKL